MKNKTLSRRNFIKSTGIVVASSSVSQTLFAMGPARPKPEPQPQTPVASGNGEIMIKIFLRGGLDGLSVVAPSAGTNHSILYGTNGVRTDLKLNIPISLTNDFKLNSACPEMKKQFDAKNLLFIQGAGSPSSTRSHFTKQDLIELGTPVDNTSISSTGYLDRAIQSLKTKKAINPALPALAIAATLPKVFQGGAGALAVASVSPDITLLRRPDGSQAQVGLTDRIKASWLKSQDGTWLDRFLFYKASLAVKALKMLEDIPREKTNDFRSNADYGNLAQIRNAAKAAVYFPGTRFIEVDVSSFDTHFNQGPNEGGGLYNLLSRVDKALGALKADLVKHGIWNKTTVVIMSEFGRRVAQNGSLGTDHGFGGLMMVCGGKVKGGRVIHQGFDLRQLKDGGDVHVTTDYRQVIAEVLTTKIGLAPADIASVFPGFAMSGQLGIY